VKANYVGFYPSDGRRADPWEMGYYGHYQ